MRNLLSHAFLLCFLMAGLLPAEAISIRVVAASDAFVELDGQTMLDVTVVNDSEVPLSSVDYTFIVNKIKSEERHYDLPQPVEVYGSEFTISLPLLADGETGNVLKQISITKANGEKNGSENNKTDFTHFTLTRLENKKVVMEEYTGLWCGFCPRGEAAINRLEDEFGPRFIGFSIHSDDVLENSDYVTASLMSTTFPKASLQRSLNYIDPYLGTTSGYTEVCPIRHDVERLMAMPSEAALDIAPVWTSDAHTAVNTNAKVTFRFSSSKARYAIGYVLIEDSMTGTGKDWAQANYYYKDEDYRRRFHGDEYMDEFLDPEVSVEYNGTSYIPDYVCNRVVISALGIQRGIANSIPLQITEDETLVIEHEMLALNSKIQNKDHLSVIGLLFNVNTGLIVNAAKAKIGGDSALNIDYNNETGQPVETMRFSIGGQRLNGMVRGLNIVRMNDGSVRKVIVR